MATSRNGDNRRPKDGFCLDAATSDRVAAMLEGTGFEGIPCGKTIVVQYNGTTIIFGLVQSMAGLGHDQLLSVTLGGYILENVVPTADQIKKALRNLAQRASSLEAVA